jgi:hypothetical protein
MLELSSQAAGTPWLLCAKSRAMVPVPVAPSRIIKLGRQVVGWWLFGVLLYKSCQDALLQNSRTPCAPATRTVQRQQVQWLQQRFYQVREHAPCEHASMAAQATASWRAAACAPPPTPPELSLHSLPQLVHKQSSSAMPFRKCLAQPRVAGCLAASMASPCNPRETWSAFFNMVHTETRRRV